MRLFAVLFLIMGCVKPIDPPANAPQSVPTTIDCSIVDYGSGVLLFNECEYGFSKLLAAYIGANLNKEVVSITNIHNIQSRHNVPGTRYAYLVLTREKAVAPAVPTKAASEQSAVDKDN